MTSVWKTPHEDTSCVVMIFSKARGREAKLGFLGRVLMENRHGLALATRPTRATGASERQASLETVREKQKSSHGRFTLGGDKNYDTRELVAALHKLNITPHVAQDRRSSNLFFLKKDDFSSACKRTVCTIGVNSSSPPSAGKSRVLEEAVFGDNNHVNLTDACGRDVAVLDCGQVHLAVDSKQRACSSVG